jgi:hypothetical protein
VVLNTLAVTTDAAAVNCLIFVEIAGNRKRSDAVLSKSESRMYGWITHNAFC